MSGRRSRARSGGRSVESESFIDYSGPTPKVSLRFVAAMKKRSVAVKNSAKATLIAEDAKTPNDQKVEKVSHVLAKMKKSVECPICLDFLENPVKGNCDHHFCEKCITKHINAETGGQYTKRGGNKSNCPICQKPITKRALHPIAQLADAIANAKEVTAKFGHESNRKVINQSDGSLVLAPADEHPSSTSVKRRSTNEAPQDSTATSPVGRELSKRRGRPPILYSPEKAKTSRALLPGRGIEKSPRTRIEDRKVVPVAIAAKNIRKRKQPAVEPNPYDFSEDAGEKSAATPSKKKKEAPTNKESTPVAKNAVEASLQKKRRGRPPTKEKTTVIEEVLEPDQEKRSDEEDLLIEPLSPSVKPQVPRFKKPREAAKSTSSSKQSVTPSSGSPTKSPPSLSDSVRSTSPILKVSGRRTLPIASPKRRNFDTPEPLKKTPFGSGLVTSTPAVNRRRPQDFSIDETPVLSVEPATTSSEAVSLGKQSTSSDVRANGKSRRRVPSPSMLSDDESVEVMKTGARNYAKHTIQATPVVSTAKLSSRASALFDRAVFSVPTVSTMVQTDPPPPAAPTKEDDMFARLSTLFNTLCCDRGVEGSITIEGIGRFEIALKKRERGASQSQKPLSQGQQQIDDEEEDDFFGSCSQVVKVTSEKSVQVNLNVVQAPTTDEATQCENDDEDMSSLSHSRTFSEGQQTESNQTLDAETYTDLIESLLTHVGTQTMIAGLAAMDETDIVGSSPPALIEKHKEKDIVTNSITIQSQENGDATETIAENGHHDESIEKERRDEQSTLKEPKVANGNASKDDDDDIFDDDDSDFLRNVDLAVLDATKSSKQAPLDMPSAAGDVDQDEFDEEEMRQLTIATPAASDGSQFTTDHILNEIVPESDPEDG